MCGHLVRLRIKMLTFLKLACFCPKLVDFEEMHNFVNDLADFKFKVICVIGSVYKRQDEAATENFIKRQSGGSNVPF